MRDELLHASADPVEEAEEVTLRPRRLDEFVGQPRLKEHLEILLSAAARPGPGRRPPPVRRAARAWARPRSSGIVAERDGRQPAHHQRARARTGRRPRRHPHQPRRRRRAVHRRDPPPPASGRGGALPGDGGLPARHRDRQGPGGALDPPRPPALHARSAPPPAPVSSPARCATASASSPASTTTTPTTSSPSSSAPPASSACRSRPKAPIEIARRVAGHAPHRQPPAEARARLRRGARRRRRHHRDRAARARAVRGRRARPRQGRPRHPRARCARRSAASRSGCTPWRWRWPRSPRRWRRSTSRSSSRPGCSAHAPGPRRHARRLRAPPPARRPTCCRACSRRPTNERRVRSRRGAVLAVAAVCVGVATARRAAPRGRRRVEFRPVLAQLAPEADTTTTAPVDLAAARATVAVVRRRRRRAARRSIPTTEVARLRRRRVRRVPGPAGGRELRRGTTSVRRPTDRRSATRSAEFVSRAGLDGAARPHQGRGRRRGTRLAEQQFHQQVAITLEGIVVSAPTIQPNDPKFTSFDGDRGVSGSFTQQAGRGPGRRGPGRQRAVKFGATAGAAAPVGR